MTIQFGTKAETLERLETAVTTARILPQLRTDWRGWSTDAGKLLAAIEAEGWIDQPVIVRSSAQAEDRSGGSLAGHYLSIPNVRGREAIREAVGRVFKSYGKTIRADDQVLVQPYLDDVTASGVAFSREPSSGAPYIVINYSLSSAADAVTGGASDDLRTFYYWRHGRLEVEGFLAGVVALVKELERLLQSEAIDVEFAISVKQGPCLLQVRPLHVAKAAIDANHHKTLLSRIAQRIESGSLPHPYLHGRRSMFGVMPDWNPAEIIGTRPRPLALSLYRNLITDQIWAYQRSNYGYKNLRSFPLLVSFCGLPYVDVRVSFNSFVPFDIESGLADRLVDYYLSRLRSAPALHDKVEFEIVFSCYTIDLPQRLNTLLTNGFSKAEIQALTHSLRRLTNQIIHTDKPLWREEFERIRELEVRREAILNAEIDEVSRIYWLIEDCKRWGTLPFAGLARAGFIAMQLLRSVVAAGIISEAQYTAFMAGLDTITSQMVHDLRTMKRAAFLAKYGHLRPGTYDILSARYDEAPDRYLGGEAAIAHEPKAVEPFQLTAEQGRALSSLLAEHGLTMNAAELFEFFRFAIQGREHAKFVFTRSLSDVLRLVRELGRKHGLDVEDMSFADISVIEQLYGSAAEPAEALRQSIAGGRARYAEARQIILPPLIVSSADVWSFHMPPNEPNYVTQGMAEGRVCTCDDEDLKGAIVFINQADPGFDWIFSKGIAGLVTAYGGVNSHMAIRAGEAGLPAVIGAGESLFEIWRRAKRIRLDCAARRVEVLQS